MIQLRTVAVSTSFALLLCGAAAHSSPANPEAKPGDAQQNYVTPSRVPASSPSRVYKPLDVPAPPTVTEEPQPGAKMRNVPQGNACQFDEDCKPTSSPGKGVYCKGAPPIGQCATRLGGAILRR